MNRSWSTRSFSVFRPLVLAASFLNPLHRLLREFVERGHAKFQMFFLRVLDFVVADAVQALDKHHYRRHTGGRDFGGVVQRAARQAMHFAAGFGNGISAELNQIFVEQNGFDLPEAFPRNFYVAFFRKFFTGSFCFDQHFASAAESRWR